MLEYASVVWEPTKNSTPVALERSQMNIARAITHLPQRRHSNEAVLAKIGWPTQAWRRRRYKLLLVWRLINGEGPCSVVRNASTAGILALGSCVVFQM